MCFNEAGGFLPRRSERYRRKGGCADASMRPEDFSPGGSHHHAGMEHGQHHASMRPEDFSPGGVAPRFCACQASLGFNEAGGFLPRRTVEHKTVTKDISGASMRPEDFSPGGSQAARRGQRPGQPGFNEAGGFLPRRSHGGPGQPCQEQRRFNEAGGFLPRRSKSRGAVTTLEEQGFNEAGGFLPRRRSCSPGGAC